jgi:hypothetical protein
MLLASSISAATQIRHLAGTGEGLNWLPIWPATFPKGRFNLSDIFRIKVQSHHPTGVPKNSSPTSDVLGNDWLPLSLRTLLRLTSRTASSTKDAIRQ